MEYKSKKITLSPKKNDHKNIIQNGKNFYKLEYLSAEQKESKGGNSSVFKLIDPNTEVEYAIKFLINPSNSKDPYDIKQNIRFENEIKALYEAKSKGFENVVEIFFDGEKKVGETTFRFYVMEKAVTDLSAFLAANTIAFNQKVFLSFQIVNGIQQLHSMDPMLYHRDIKPDNIFIVMKRDKIIWKVGDLGLSARRGEDLSKIEFREKIGPFGWLSPEVTNKVLCEGTILEQTFDCVVDDKSDVFQLGKLIWFIFQGNIPVGQIQYADFLPKNKAIFGLIRNMLQYKKSRRKELIYFAEKLQVLSA